MSPLSDPLRITEKPNKPSGYYTFICLASILDVLPLICHLKAYLVQWEMKHHHTGHA